MSLPAGAVQRNTGLVAHFEAEFAVECYADPVFGIILVCPANIPYKDERAGVYNPCIEKELFQWFLLRAVVLFGQRAAGEQALDIGMFHPLPVFDNGGIEPAFNLEKFGVCRVIVVAADAELEAVLLAGQALLAELKVRGIEIQTDNRVAASGLEFAIAVYVKIGLDEFLDRRGLCLADLIFALIPAPQRAVGSDCGAPQRRNATPWPALPSNILYRISCHFHPPPGTNEVPTMGHKQLFFNIFTTVTTSQICLS
jgi:hypothetical protein